ncbi:hypothetical protein BGZ57DRAFT_855649 [Hyaloscypha finlandica]|nr:hypothetical protein BGZ57DRAFT_855649 [Hyaloscypha finlandica]
MLSRRKCAQAQRKSIARILLASRSSKYSLVQEVHANLICSVSHFFEKTFNGGCAEGTENKMNLPEDESETVSMFVAWLYNKRELVFDRKSCVSSSGTRGFIDLFVFIDAKQCNPLKNTVLGTLQDTLCWVAETPVCDDFGVTQQQSGFPQNLHRDFLLVQRLQSLRRRELGEVLVACQGRRLKLRTVRHQLPLSSSNPSSHNISIMESSFQEGRPSPSSAAVQNAAPTEASGPSQQPKRRVSTTASSEYRKHSLEDILHTPDGISTKRVKSSLAVVTVPECNVELQSHGDGSSKSPPARLEYINEIESLYRQNERRFMEMRKSGEVGGSITGSGIVDGSDVYGDSGIK